MFQTTNQMWTFDLEHHPLVKIVGSQKSCGRLLENHLKWGQVNQPVCLSQLSFFAVENYMASSPYTACISSLLSISKRCSFSWIKVNSLFTTSSRLCLKLFPKVILLGYSMARGKSLLQSAGKNQQGSTKGAATRWMRIFQPVGPAEWWVNF